MHVLAETHMHTQTSNALINVKLHHAQHGRGGAMWGLYLLFLQCPLVGGATGMPIPHLAPTGAQSQ